MLKQPFSGVRRVTCYERCRLETDEDAREGALWNLSVLGAYVSVDPVPRLGERVRVVFVLPGTDQPVEVAAEVAWRNTVHDPRCLALPHGCGLHFVDLSPEGREQIAAALGTGAA